MSREELAGRLGVSKETVRRWELGGARPSQERLAQIIAVLSINAVELPPVDIDQADLPPLARRLRNERAHRAITQVEAAQLLGVAQPTYAGWEVGRAVPGSDHLPGLAELLGLTLAELQEIVDVPFTIDTASWPPLGRLMGARRQDLRLTRAALAAAIDVSEATVVAWELGYRKPRDQHLPELAAALRVSVPELTAVIPRSELSALGELIRSRQQQLGVPRRDIAARAGVDEVTLSRWANGHNQPRSSSLRRLADALELPLQEVIGVSGIGAP